MRRKISMQLSRLAGNARVTSALRLANPSTDALLHRSAWSLPSSLSLPVPQASVNNCFIRGSVVRYIHLPKEAVDLEVLHDATRRNHRGEQAK